MGMAELLHRSWDTDLVGWVSALVSTQQVSEVKSALTVAEPELNAGTLIGASRAADLAVSVVLPFAHAWGFITKITALSEGAMSFYRSWPPLQENAITKETLRVLSAHMEGNSAKLPFKRTARRQQGLIYLYKRYLQGG
tara:strand:- start:1095 stop:1511 length:417 start_codon:yes stop_codon:yes gene_type:complete